MKPNSAPAVGGLVQVHEVHVDLAQGRSRLNWVELQQGVLQLAQRRDPHLGGEKVCIHTMSPRSAGRGWHPGPPR